MIFTASLFGYEGAIVEAECDVRSGLPATDIVGISDSWSQQTRETIVKAYESINQPVPQHRILMSLSPADLKKDNSQYSLALALALAETYDSLDTDKRIFVWGDLQPDGTIRHQRGFYAAIQTAVENGMEYIITTRDTHEPLPDPKDCKVFCAENLKDCINILDGIKNKGF